MITLIAASGGVSIPGVDEGQVEAEQRRRDPGADQRSADQDAEDDRRDRRPLDPAVGDDELLRRQELGQDPVLGRRIGGRAEADHRVRGERMEREQHHRAADHLDAVGDQHDAALRHRIGERADQRGEQHVGQDEALLQARRHPAGLVEVAEQGDRGDQQRVVGERAEELRRHDRVEAGLHRSPGRGRRPAKARNAARACARYNRRVPPAARALYHDCRSPRNRACSPGAQDPPAGSGPDSEKRARWPVRCMPS